MVHLGRIITDVVILLGILAIYFNVIDTSGVGFLYNTVLPFYNQTVQIILIIVLVAFFAIDSLYFGPPPIFNIILVIVLSSLILSNYGLGILFGILTFILLITISRLFRRKGR